MFLPIFKNKNLKKITLYKCTVYVWIMDKTFIMFFNDKKSSRILIKWFIFKTLTVFINEIIRIKKEFSLIYLFEKLKNSYIWK